VASGSKTSGTGRRAARKGDGEPARRLTPKGEATRNRLIDLAAEVFAEEGYAAVSMRDIAARSGLSSGAIYGSFRGKADLLAEAVDATIAADVETLPAAVTQQSLPEIEAYQYEHAARRGRVRVLLLEAAVAARTDRTVASRVSAALQPHLDMATEAQQEWRSGAGVDPDVDMAALVTLLWSADLGLGVLDALGVDTPEPEVWAGLIRALLYGLEGPDATPAAPTKRDLPRTKRRRS
jgi:AcrR family transcriptional regulator